MNYEDNTSAPNDTRNLLVADVRSTGTGPRESFEIAPEHKHHADAILAADPLSVPLPHDIPDGWGASPLALISETLPPELQGEVQAKLNALGPVTPEHRAAKESEFTALAARSLRAGMIASAGVSSKATPYHRELAAIAGDVKRLSAEYDRYQEELGWVLRYDTEYDEATGEAIAVPVYAITGARAESYAANQQDILRRIRLLVNDDGTPGIEGARRAKEALFESVAARVEIERQRAEEVEARQLAQDINREKRIRARAESLARLKRNGG